MKYIYKICPSDVWKRAKVVGKFNGYGIDLDDGFIHFSTSKQVKETLKLHFWGKNDLYLLKININKINIKWEKARNNQLFPHLYGSFNTNCVEKEIHLIINLDGSHKVPLLD